MEKPLAAAAGLGWQGKHTNLVSREFGSWLFLGAIFTTLDLPPDAPETDHCGTCRACLDICPTAAFPGALSARCAALHLLSHHRAQGPDPARVARRRSATASMAATIASRSVRGTNSPQAGRETKLAARAALRAPRSPILSRLDDAAFRALFAKSAVKRIGRARFLRNVLIAIGNSGDAPLASGGRAIARRCLAARARRSDLGAGPARPGAV